MFFFDSILDLYKKNNNLLIFKLFLSWFWVVWGKGKFIKIMYVLIYNNDIDYLLIIYYYILYELIKLYILRV